MRGLLHEQRSQRDFTSGRTGCCTGITYLVSTGDTGAPGCDNLGGNCRDWTCVGQHPCVDAVQHRCWRNNVHMRMGKTQSTGVHHPDCQPQHFLIFRKTSGMKAARWRNVEVRTPTSPRQGWRRCLFTKPSLANRCKVEFRQPTRGTLPDISLTALCTTLTCSASDNRANRAHTVRLEALQRRLPHSLASWRW